MAAGVQVVTRRREARKMFAKKRLKSLGSMPLAAETVTMLFDKKSLFYRFLLKKFDGYAIMKKKNLMEGGV